MTDPTAQQLLDLVRADSDRRHRRAVAQNLQLIAAALTDPADSMPRRRQLAARRAQAAMSRVQLTGQPQEQA